MSRIARSELAPADEVGYYHCYNKTMDGITLCGVDPETKVDYSERRIWIFEYLQVLAALMMIDFLRVSIMRNHFHLLVRPRPDLVRQLTDSEVIKRMVELCPTSILKAGEKPTLSLIELRTQEALRDPDKISRFRSRLSSISWMMKLFQQMIAKRCNQELKRKGALFIGRFKSKRLESEAAVLACATYIDLNPIRAMLNDTPEESLNTSIHWQVIGRLQRARRAIALGVHLPVNGDLWLDTAFASPLDADGWLAPITLDPAHRLHHQVQRWQDNEVLQSDLDLTGNDPDLQQLLQRLKEFQWLTTRRQLEDTEPSTAQTPSRSNDMKPEMNTSSTSVSVRWTKEFAPQSLEEFIDLFESFIANCSVEQISPDDRDESHELVKVDQVGTSDTETIASREDGTEEEQLALAEQEAAQRALLEHANHRRPSIASCRHKLQELSVPPRGEGSCSSDGKPSGLSRRLASILRRCSRPTPAALISCNQGGTQGGNHYPCRRASNRGFLPITSEEYLVLLEQTGRVIRADKPGSIPADLPPILERLGLQSAEWFNLMLEFDNQFSSVVGSAEEIRKRRQSLKQKKIQGLIAARRYFASL